MHTKEYIHAQKSLNKRLDKLMSTKTFLSILQMEVHKELSDLHKNWKEMPSPK